MNAQLEQRIANRVRVEVAKMVQVGKEPTPDSINPDWKLKDQLGLDSLDFVDLADNIEERLALADASLEYVCQQDGATVEQLIEAAKEAYEAAHGGREVV